MRLGKVKFGRMLLIGSAIVSLTLGLVWSQRRPIAAGAIDRALVERGINASYIVEDIGFQTQRIENLRIGNPANPDLTAEWVEVSLKPGWSGVTVSALKARGVRLRGRIIDGRASWGEIDKLLPVSTGKSFTLPAIHVQLSDARLLLETKIGNFVAVVAGSGQLRDGFKGRLMAVAPFAGRDDCRLDAPVLDAIVAVQQRKPHLVGTLRSAPSTCGTFRAGPSETRFDVTLSEALDRWKGRGTVATGAVRQNTLQMAQPHGYFNFAGNAGDTQGTFTVAGSAARFGEIRAVGLSADGSFRVGRAHTMAGRLKVERAIVDPAQVAAFRRALGGAVGTPVGPIAGALSQAIGSAGQGAVIDARFDYSGAAVRLLDFRAAARGGGTLLLRNGAVTVDSAGIAAEADLAIAGGGFPAAHGRLTRAADGSTRGVFSMTPYRAGTAQLTLSPIRFAARRDGTMRVETVATLDGPIGDGRVEGVRMPLVIQRTSTDDIVFAPGCTPIAYRRIVLAGTALAPSSVTLCPTRGEALIRSTRTGVTGGARTGPLRLAGRVGNQALVMATSGASFDLNGPISVADFSAFIGATDRRTQFDVVRLDGVARRDGLSGHYSGLAGNISRVPFLASAGRGTWHFARGGLDIAGTLMLADQALQPRFKPLSAQDMRLRLRGGHVDVTATLHEPVSTKTVTTLTITHDLSRGVGQARFSVDGLTFSKTLQPEALTPLTLGVVADVYGQIDGSGVIRWNGDTVTSSGKFRSDTLDLAAAFGPVTGASGEIEFDDLIALSTPLGQHVKLAMVNPGVEVKDGIVTFRLRPNQVVEIERGHWPFAGGELVLDPALLDFGQTKPRTLQFRVISLDAAKFIEQLKLENIAATGTFDGTLPIVFDATGGRIVGGKIVARAGGGTVAYVGDVSNAQTNTLAKLAFDALKSIRYGNLVIDLNGSLDGEIVSLVRFDGFNQSPVAPSGIAKSLVGLPFKFKIRIQAPFRGLVNTERSFQDPGLLLNRPVQPVASGNHP